MKTERTTDKTDPAAIEEVFEKVCMRFTQYMKEKRASTQPQKLADLRAAYPDYILDTTDDLVREGLVEHIGLLPILATTIYPYINDESVDLGEALIMLAIHDIGETVTGDTIMYAKKDADAEQEHKIAIDLLDPMYHEAYRLVEDPSTPTSRFAKCMDKIVADFLDYLCPAGATMERYDAFLAIKTPTEVIELKKKHKAHYFEWNPFLKDLFEYGLARTNSKLSSYDDSMTT